ncbi:MAG TPA: hypothetical protein PLY76_06535 [Flavobacteriales bacterium]|nr:hypothetical protein [Flavobacteriales bacterium]HRP81537.1 hypothetical protein [Flavobacteriales bacterium]
MMHLRRLPLLLLAVAATGQHAAGQSNPVMGAFQYSNGVHPSFDALLEDAPVREVERYWLNELKAISMKVTTRKEITGHTARIPAASPDTLQVLVAVERPKGSLYTTAHIAFFTTAGYVGPDSPERELNGCTEWVRQRTVALRRQLATNAVDRGRRELDNLNRQLDMLRREGQRAENNLRRSRERIEQAARDSTEAVRQLQELATAPDTAGKDSVAMAILAKQRTRDIRRWQDRAKRATSTRQGSEKRVSDLQWAITRNQADQVAKEAEVARQEAVVKELEEKLQAIN